MWQIQNLQLQYSKNDGIPAAAAVFCSHIPDRGEQTVYYYGFSSNVVRCRHKKDSGLP
jgi:hypothetical protein